MRFFLCMALLQSIGVSAFVSNDVTQARGIRPGGSLPFFTGTTSPTRPPHASSTSLFVFDFFKKRSDEGLQQLNNIADAAYKGKLGEGLQDVAAYTSETNAAFANGLAKSRKQLVQNLELLLTGNSESMLEELTDILLQADLGMATSEAVVEEVKSLLGTRSQRGLSRDDLKSILRGKLTEALEIQGEQSRAIQFSKDSSITPTVLFVMGANGMGKTTTIGKLAHRLRVEGNQTVLVAACDTFRAGAVEQLEQWANRAEVDCYTPNEQRSTPSAVLYGALDKAIAEGFDTVLVDTSGRLSNNEALTQELAKMKRVIQKRLSVEDDSDGKPALNRGVPHETLLVLDAAQGRMALDSAKVWQKEIGLSGLILTKLDGSARGGSVVSISKELDLPVKLIGVGEGIDDLRDFEPEVFVDGLLGIGKAGGQSSSNEGALLEKRLYEMRKARDASAKSTSKTSGTTREVNLGGGGVSGSTTGSSAGGLTFQEMESPPVVPVGEGRGPSMKPNRKKKKKRKGRR